MPQAYDAALDLKPDFATAMTNRDKLPLSDAYKVAAAYEGRVLASRAARVLLATSTIAGPASATAAGARATGGEETVDETLVERYEDALRASPAAFGGACGIVLLANRALGGVAPAADASSAQSRADVICLAMAACLILTGFTWVALKTKPPDVVDLVGARLDEPYVSTAASADAREELLWAWNAARAATNCDVMAVFTKDGERIMQAGVAANALADPSALERRAELGPIVSAAASRGARGGRYVTSYSRAARSRAFAPRRARAGGPCPRAGAGARRTARPRRHRGTRRAPRSRGRPRR